MIGLIRCYLITTAEEDNTTHLYKKIALHVFDIFLFNTHCLNSKYGVDKSFNLLKFRETIIIGLVGESLKEILRNKTNNTSDVHYLTAIPPYEKKDCRQDHAKFAPK